MVRAVDSCSLCSSYLMSRPFHVFGCGCKFHTDCLTEQIVPYLSQGRKRRLEEVTAELAALEAKGNSSAGQVNVFVWSFLTSPYQ